MDDNVGFLLQNVWRNHDGLVAQMLLAYAKEIVEALLCEVLELVPILLGDTVPEPKGMFAGLTSVSHSGYSL